MTQPDWITGGFQVRPDAQESPPAEQAGSRELRIRYVPHRPIDLRVHDWLASWIVTPIERHPDLRAELLKHTENYSPILAPWVLRIRRAKIGLVSCYLKMRLFLWALTGPRVGSEILERRKDVCTLCPFIRIRLPARQGGRVRRYCGSCGCPDWWLSELGYKNRLERWICPRGLHPRRPDWRETLVRELEEQRREVIELEQSRRDNGDRGNNLAIDDRELEPNGELDERGSEHRRRTNGRQARR